MSAFACLVVPYFSAAAVERVEPALRERPLAVISGVSPMGRVLDANDAARALGVHPPMTEAEARARCPEVSLRALSEDVVRAARHALLDAALAVSPRVEDAAAGIVHVDTGGLERLIGDATAVGRRLLRDARRVGFTATVGLAETRAVARVAARLGPALTVVAPGRERATLADGAIALLEPDAATAATLERWGVRTLGQLAALPRAGVSARLGAAGLRLHDLASGHDRAPFRAWSPPPFYQEARALEWEIATLEALRPVLLLVLERLAERLTVSHLAADVLDADFTLASGEHHHRRIPLAHPMADAKAMLALTLLDIEAHPPGAGITAVAITAQAVRAAAGPSGLWEPRLPAARDLATVLTRLTALVGAPAVGAPVIIDSHHPDAVALTRFDAGIADHAGAARRRRTTAEQAEQGEAVGPDGRAGRVSPRKPAYRRRAVFTATPARSSGPVPGKACRGRH
jgi:protein ImuB